MTDFIIRMLEQSGYLGIAFLMALENVVPPIPSEIIMGFSGVFAAQGRYNPYYVILAGTIGSTAGNAFWYYLGRKFSRSRMEAFVRRWGRWLTIDWHSIERANAAFVRRGGAIIFFARCVPTLRTIISLPAGLFGMSWPKFIAWTLAGTCIWNTALVFAGYQLGLRVEGIEAWLGPVSWAVIGLIVLVYIYRVIFWRPHQQDDVQP